MLYRRLFKIKEDTQSITNLEAAHWYLCSLEGTSTLHAQVLQWVFCKIWRLVHFAGCVQHFWKVGTSSCTLWGLHHFQGLSLHQLRQPDHHILLQELKWCTRLHPSYLLVTIMAILPIKLVSATFLLRNSFVIIVGKRDWRAPKFLVWPKRVQRVGFAKMVRNLVPLPASNTKRGRGVMLEASGLD